MFNWMARILICLLSYHSVQALPCLLFRLSLTVDSEIRQLRSRRTSSFTCLRSYLTSHTITETSATKHIALVMETHLILRNLISLGPLLTNPHSPSAKLSPELARNPQSWKWSCSGPSNQLNIRGASGGLDISCHLKNDADVLKVLTKYFRIARYVYPLLEIGWKDWNPCFSETDILK